MKLVFAQAVNEGHTISDLNFFLCITSNWLMMSGFIFPIIMEPLTAEAVCDALVFANGRVIVDEVQAF